jgi:hypothetical protein
MARLFPRCTKARWVNSRQRESSSNYDKFRLWDTRDNCFDKPGHGWDLLIDQRDIGAFTHIMLLADEYHGAVEPLLPEEYGEYGL